MIVWHLGENLYDGGYRVLTGSSFGDYLADWLIDAAAEYRLTARGALNGGMSTSTLQPATRGALVRPGPRPGFPTPWRTLAVVVTGDVRVAIEATDRCSVRQRSRVTSQRR